MSYTKIHKRWLSDEIATMKAKWHDNMEKIDKLYMEKFRMEASRRQEGLHLLNKTISNLATKQISLDYKIQEYHMAKIEYLNSQFQIHKSLQS